MNRASEWKPVEIVAYQEPILDPHDRTRVQVQFNLNQKPPKEWADNWVLKIPQGGPVATLDGKGHLFGTWPPANIPTVYQKLVKLVAQANADFERDVLPQWRQMEAVQESRRQQLQKLKDDADAVLASLPIPIYVEMDV